MGGGRPGFLDWWLWVTVAVFLALSWVAFLGAPDVQGMLVTQRIFYFHFGAAIAAALSFTVLFVTSIAYLVRRKSRWDVLAAASAEVGVVFTAMVLLTGTVWAKAQWGAWWTWDPKLTTTLILWFLGVAYALLREGVVDQRRRAAYAAVLGVIIYLDIPIIFVASRIWSSIHPIVINNEGFNMSPPILWATVLGVVANVFWMVFWVGQRAVQGRMEVEVAELKERLREG